MHQKRNEMPKAWPLPRKGKKYIAVASHSKSKSIPIIFIIRDILKFAETKKEVKYMLNQGQIKINNKVRKDERFPCQVFDTISFEKINKHFRIIIQNRKLRLHEINKQEADKKIVKIIGKRLLKNKRIQMSLEDGKNFFAKENFGIGDSVIVNNSKNIIEKVLYLKEGANIEVVSGKHAGEKGKLRGIKPLEKGKRYLVKLNDSEVELPLKTILVIE